MITIFQGESCAWQGHLLDDEDMLINDIQSYKVHFILKSQSGKPLYEWDNENILFGEGGYFALRLTPEASSVLPPGIYGLEVSLTVGDISVAIAKDEKVLNIRPSTIGVIGE